METSASDRRPVHAYALVVLLNYLAQIPYNLDLYRGRYSPTGALLLGLTFAWFVCGYLLFLSGRRLGFWILLAYAVVQVVFYLYGDVVLAFAGYGLPYQLTHARDTIVWLVFLVGDANFVAAALVLVHLVRARRRFA